MNLFSLCFLLLVSLFSLSYCIESHTCGNVNRANLVNPQPTKVKVSPDGSRVTLTPNGFSTFFPAQDTVNLQWVFNNYPHSDINLERGIFHISETIEAPGYQGRIKGDGVAKTFLVGRGPLIGSDYVFPMLNADLTARLYPSGVPHLIWFHAVDGGVNNWAECGVNLELKDLTVRLDGVGPEITYFGQPFRSIWVQISVTGYRAVLDTNIPGTDKVSNIKALVKNVKFIASNTPYTLNGQEYFNSNSAVGFLCYGGEHWLLEAGLNGYTEDQHSPVNAQIVVQDSIFENFHQYGIGAEETFTTSAGSTYTFPTDPVFAQSHVTIKNNKFKNVGNGANLLGSLGFNVLVLGISETLFDITDNLFDGMLANGIGLITGFAETNPRLTSYFNIRDNTFNRLNSPSEGNSIWLMDTTFFSQPGYYNIIVKDNIFNGAVGYNDTFIEIGCGMNSLIDDNRFNGHALSAIAIGNEVNQGQPLPATAGKVTDNVFSGLVTSVANVILGHGSSNCYVAVQNPAGVLNSGTNNTVVSGVLGDSQTHEVEKCRLTSRISKILKFLGKFESKFLSKKDQE